MGNAASERERAGNEAPRRSVPVHPTGLYANGGIWLLCVVLRTLSTFHIVIRRKN